MSSSSITLMLLIENNWSLLSSRRENESLSSLCCCFVCFNSFVQTLALSSVLFDFRAGAAEGLFVVKSDIQANNTTAGMQANIWPSSFLHCTLFCFLRFSTTPRHFFRVILNRQDSSILPALVAKHSVGFAHSRSQPYTMKPHFTDTRLYITDSCVGTDQRLIYFLLRTLLIWTTDTFL